MKLLIIIIMAELRYL